MIRPSKRKNNQLRNISIEKNILSNADASCFIKFGNTHVICAASVDSNVPRFLKGTGSGWISAEYGMLPRSTVDRMQREVTRGGASGRTQEIQRLIGRALRAAVNLKALGERQILIDCDVINADGGTRCAAITGGYVALHLALRSLTEKKVIKINPLKYQVAAVSCGLYRDEVIADLDFAEDNAAQVDANFVFNSMGNLIEVQATGEEHDFTQDQLKEMTVLAQEATQKLFQIQNQVLLDL